MEAASASLQAQMLQELKKLNRTIPTAVRDAVLGAGGVGIFSG
jgi:hypothetical protein